MAVNMENFEIQEDEDISDEDIAKEAHHKLLNAVSRLYKKQRIEAPKRREPVQEISEFTLSSGVKEFGKTQTVNVNELLGDLKERATHQEIKKKINIAQKKATKLPKPLEKTVELKITRKVGYDNVKNELNKWSSIVERNKLASQLTFPLHQKKIELNNTFDFLTSFKQPTELEIEMAKVLNQSDIAKKERKEEKKLSKLSIEEMIERRNITAKMRARESYRISKAIRQNRIKSKKFHRILKKEKIKQELKNFEKLQKTDPEAALEKLEQIERARAEERISLRHKNTGKWARSKAIRAKYDSEARIQLAEQLAKSRELTKKLKSNETSDSEIESDVEKSEIEGNLNSNKPNKTNGVSKNPWVSEFDEFLSGFNKFSSNSSKNESNHGKERVANDADENCTKSLHNMNCEESVEKSSDQDLSISLKLDGNSDKNIKANRIRIEVIQKNDETQGINDHKINEESKPQDNDSKNVNEASLLEINDENEDEIDSPEIESEVLDVDSDANEGSDDNNVGFSRSHKEKSIHEIFDGVEDVIQNHVDASVEKFKSLLKSNEDDKFEKDKEDEQKPKRFELKQKTKLHDIDTALIEVADEGISSGKNDLKLLKDKLKTNSSEKEKEPQIDPDKVINVKPQKLSSELPDFEENGDLSDDEEEKQKHLNLMEAFAEDDLVDQFREDKKESAKSSKGKEINLEMPGWGSWGGTGVKIPSKRKKRRFIVKLPKVPRKDEKKPNVIINEDPVPKLREQMVSELPYPFTSVSDYEASIRAPIGKNWVTEKGFKKLTAPSIVTKMGTIIEPMNSDMLVRTPMKRINNERPNNRFNKKKFTNKF